MQIIRPPLKLQVIVTAENETGTHMLQRLMPVGVLHHPRILYIECCLTTVKTARQIAEQGAHSVPVKVHEHSLNHQQKLGVRVQAVQLIHPPGVKSRSSQQRLTPLRRQQLLPQSNNIRQINIVKRYAVGSSADTFPAAIQTTPHVYDHRVRVALNEISG